MPVTPFHFGPGAALHAIAPARVSFVAFCAANVVIDIESGYHLLMAHDRVHVFFHTYLGASLVILAVTALLWMVRPVTRRWRFSFFGWERLTRGQVILGAAWGGYSHVLLDSVMHADITPLAPFSDRNALHGALSWGALHAVCVGLGVAGVLILVVRMWVARRGSA